MGLLSGLGGLGGLLGGGGGGDSLSSGGIGNSKSANETTTISGDSSAAGNNNQMIVTGGTNTLTDHGAIDAALSLALKGIEASNLTAQQIAASNGGLLAGALSNSADQNKQFASTVENIKTSDVRVLIVAALAVVGLVGFVAFKGKKG